MRAFRKGRTNKLRRKMMKEEMVLLQREEILRESEQ